MCADVHTCYMCVVVHTRDMCADVHTCYMCVDVHARDMCADVHSQRLMLGIFQFVIFLCNQYILCYY